MNVQILVQGSLIVKPIIESDLPMGEQHLLAQQKTKG